MPQTSNTVPVPSSEITTKRGSKDFVTPKLVAALDKCQLSIRESVYILQAAVKALGVNIDEFPINKSSIQWIWTQMSKPEAIKSDFQDDVPDVVTTHWNGKLLPGLDVRSCKEGRLPVLISFDNKEQLLAVPKLDSCTGKDQAKAVLNAIYDWDLNDKMQVMYCDTTTGRLCAFRARVGKRAITFLLSSSYLQIGLIKCV